AVGVLFLAMPAVATAQPAARASHSAVVVAIAQPVAPVGYVDRSSAGALIGLGLGVASASALALLSIGLADYAETAPTCAAWLNRLTCIASTGPRASSVPAELTWSFVGALGIGVGVLVAALVWRSARSDSRPALALDIGPAGASVAATF